MRRIQRLNGFLLRAPNLSLLLIGCCLLLQFVLKVKKDDLILGSESFGSCWHLEVAHKLQKIRSSTKMMPWCPISRFKDTTAPDDVHKEETFKEMIFSLVVVALAFLAKGQSAVVLDDELIDLSLRTIQLAAEIHLSDEPLVPGGVVYIDEPDAAIFLQEDKYCFAIFRGTTPNLRDWLQNLDPFTGEVCSMEGQCCKTRRGFQHAYDMPDYKYNLEDNLRLCKANCPECQVVFAGHSQGAAIATVAAVAMSDLDPTIIAFGQPGTIVGDCPAIKVDKYYRYGTWCGSVYMVSACSCDVLTQMFIVNTLLDVWGGLEYDPVPYLNFGADHFGHLFVMGKSLVHNAS